MTAPEAYPLHWPEGRERTPKHRREYGRFDITPGRARDHLFDELKRLGARYPVISTNMELKLNGEPYASRKSPEDPGVAVYFEFKKRQHVFACDRYNEVWKNIRGIGKTIENLRGIARWGTGDMLERSFEGFAALPAPDASWPTVLGVGVDASKDEIIAAYLEKAKGAHPDVGGSTEQMQRINQARAEALAGRN